MFPVTFFHFYIALIKLHKKLEVTTLGRERERRYPRLPDVIFNINVFRKIFRIVILS